jgi:hypothetical protein
MDERLLASAPGVGGGSGGGDMRKQQPFSKDYIYLFKRPTAILAENTDVCRSSQGLTGK